MSFSGISPDSSMWLFLYLELVFMGFIIVMTFRDLPSSLGFFFTGFWEWGLVLTLARYSYNDMSLSTASKSYRAKHHASLYFPLTSSSTYLCSIILSLVNCQSVATMHSELQLVTLIFGVIQQIAPSLKASWSGRLLYNTVQEIFYEMMTFKAIMRNKPMNYSSSK